MLNYSVAELRINKLKLGYFVALNKIPDMIKNRGIWKDHIQLLIDSGILVCPHTIKKMAMPLVRSIQSIRILFMFNFLLSFYYSSNK